MASEISAQAPVHPTSSGRHSDCSDCGSSEGYSSESTHHTSVHTNRREFERGPQRQGNKSKQQVKKGPEARPLCLDYLNGTCSQLRSYCRYYHPKPHETVAQPTAAGVEETTTSPTRVPAPICEVWALTGFCKFGQKCWKEHPKCNELQLEQNVAEPVTKKFQEWLQSRTQGNMTPNRMMTPERSISRASSGAERALSVERRSPMSPSRCDSWHSARSNASSPTRMAPGPSFSAQDFAQAQELLLRLDRFNEVVPNLVQLMNSGRLGMHSLLPMLHSTAVRGNVIPCSLYARCAGLLCEEISADEKAKCDQLLCSLIQTMATNALNNFFPKTMEDYQTCLRNASFLGDLFLVGIAKAREMDDFLRLLLQNFEKHSVERQDLRVQMLCQVLSTTGYQVSAAEYRCIQSLTQEVRSPETLRSLWALLGTIPPPVPISVSVGRPPMPQMPAVQQPFWEHQSVPEEPVPFPVEVQAPQTPIERRNSGFGKCGGDDPKPELFVHQPYVFA